MYKKLSHDEERIMRESVSSEPAKRGSAVKSLVWFVVAFVILAIAAYAVFSMSLA